MAVQRTLTIIKPDAVAGGVAGQIISRFEQAGLKIWRHLKLCTCDSSGAQRR